MEFGLANNLKGPTRENKVKKRTAMVLFMVSAMMIVGLVTTSGYSAMVADDPYGPLRLYDGKWDIKTSDAEKNEMQVANHCTKTGLFFVCEQVVKGKSEALVVFLPVAKTATGGEEYRTQALGADASPAGEWGKLTIEGDRWVYSWENKDGEKKMYWRNVNTFTGIDKIHFEVERSDDGTTWKTQKSGDEQRAK
jgi:hypothetical protein